MTQEQQTVKPKSADELLGALIASFELLKGHVDREILDEFKENVRGCIQEIRKRDKDASSLPEERPEKKEGEQQGEVFSVKDNLPSMDTEVEISYDGGKTFDEEKAVYLERRICAGWADGGRIGSFGEGFATTHDCPAGYGLILDMPTHWRYPSPLPEAQEESRLNSPNTNQQGTL